jgi:hypothetical protein
MSYASEVLADAPKAYYRMQEASGLIQDSSGNGNHATSSTGTATYQQVGPITSDPSDFSIFFNADDFIIPDDVDIDFGDIVTVEAWLYRDDTGTTRAFTGRGSNALTLFILDADSKLGAAKAGVAIIVYSTIALSTSTWYHVAYTKSGATSKIYIDGVDRTGTVTDATLADPGAGVPMRVGADYNGTLTWLGGLDEVAFYSTALSEARIQAHYNAATTAAAASVVSGQRLVTLG